MTEEHRPGTNANPGSEGGLSRLPVPLRVNLGAAARRPPEPQRVRVEDGSRWSDPASWDVSARRINRLSLLIQALGLASIFLGLASIPFIWPRVRLLWVIGFTGMGILGGLGGVLLRGLHHRMLRDLSREAVGIRLYRTKVQRCRAGMFLCGLMLAAAVTLERALSRVGNAPAGVSAHAGAGDLGPVRGVRVDQVGPGQIYARDDLRLRVSRAFVERSKGSRPRLVVLLEASNAGKALKIDLDRMEDIEMPLVRMAALTDDFNNRYQAVERPELVLMEDDETPSSLYPGDRLRVRLIFERPVAEAQLLRLSIPPDSFRLARSVVFEIDARDLERPEPAAARRGR